ncbi:hypothetical protein D9M70_520000 [compost metagenome]
MGTCVASLLELFGMDQRARTENHFRQLAMDFRQRLQGMRSAQSHLHHADAPGIKRTGQISRQRDILDHQYRHHRARLLQHPVHRQIHSTPNPDTTSLMQAPCSKGTPTTSLPPLPIRATNTS